MLTIRDPQSSKDHVVPPEGATIGREGGGADIVVRSPAVSKRHARLFAANGGWWLKDLGSANGTFVGSERLAKPFAVTPGMVFLLSSYRFEVVAVEQEEEAEDGMGKTVTNLPPQAKQGPRAAVTETRSAYEPKPSPIRAAPPMRPVASDGPRPVTGARPQAVAAAPVAPLFKEPEPPPPEPEPVSAQTDEGEEEPLDAAPSGEVEASAQGIAGKISIAEVLKELPKAIAYYMVTVPKLLFNPMGTIRASIEDQQFPGMNGMQLAAWALPGVGTTAAVSLICAFIVVVVNAIRGAGFAIGSLITSIIVAAITMVVGGLLVAFLFHPVFKFIIKLLKGDSDEKSRTNYLIIAQAGAILSAVPSGLAVLVAAFGAMIPVVAIGALLQLVPLVVSLGASLITFALAYQWFKFFNVHRVVPIIILVLGALTVLSTVWGAIGTVRVAISSIGSGGRTHVVSVSGAVPPEVSGDVKDAMKRAQAEVASAEKEANKALGDAKAQAEEARKETEAARKQAEAAVAEANKAANDAAKTVAEAKPPPAPVAEVKAPSVAVPDSAVPSAGSDEANAGDAAAYRTFATHRDFVEKAIADNPLLLRNDDKVLALYTQLHKAERDIRKKIGKGDKGAPDDVVTERLVQADAFVKTRKLVDELYHRLAH